MTFDKYNAINHENLIKCFAAILHGSRCYFLFQTHGSLQDLWKKLRRPTLERSFLSTVLTQLHGLAEALKAIHDFTERRSPVPEENAYWDGGSHGALSPDTILIPEGTSGDGLGTFCIADNAFSSMVKTVKIKRRHRRYEQPKHDSRHGLVTLLDEQHGDVWSVGFIIFEVLIWLVYGFGGLQDLDGHLRQEGTELDLRKESFEQGNDTEVTQVIVAFMEPLSKHPICKPNLAFGDLVAITRDKLLTSDCKIRYSAEELHKSLGEVLLKAREDPQYLSPVHL